MNTTYAIIFLSLISLVSIATTFVAFSKNKANKSLPNLKEGLILCTMASVSIIAIGNFVINSNG